tara:strand:- start:455 stop:979 length:525 start_codon:yes stop_codon:yes gene_type:complete
MTYKYQSLNIFYCTLIIIGIVQNNGCGIYSFSGISIPSEINTIHVQYIQNNANLIEPNLSNNLTERLKTKCLNEGGLIWKEINPDVSFSGKIKKYEVNPIAIQNNETAAKNRLTISVEITYINNIDNSKNFNQLFTDYIDFDSTQNFYNEEIELNTAVTETLIDNIFNAAFLNW